VLSLKSNNLRADGGKALAEGLKGNQVITELNISDNDLGNGGFDMSGIIALAGVIPDMGALSTLVLKSNGLLNKESGEALASALEGNSVLTELDVSNNFDKWNESSKDGIGFAQAFAVGLIDNGGLSSLSLKSNGLLNKKSGEALAGVLKANSVLTELDISSNYDEYNGTSQDGAGFAQALAVGLIDNGALSSVNVLFNTIGTEQAQALATILKEHPTLKSLCGHRGDETELDVWGKPNKQLGAEGAIMLVPEIIDNGALTSLDLSSNRLWAEGAKIVAEAIKVTMCAPAIILDHFHVHLTSQSTAVVCYYPQDMGAILSLNLSNNSLIGSKKSIQAKL
jgi:hypothetical protein